ncbi:chromosomal replication initiator protein DnaA [Profundibacterium mesophilum]|uniref:Chromosomal replication initiator protein DnaA n=1 Tax=Profundibacterium mesophilum KAUST100406-0324 TaxID=1037889 RepID=A0A921NSW2_9RHOB|nr:chromosomal replication initiator protein DnaA [Profundibacterium mesophilum]KAF0675949.1 Chromosomal replication initiator protein DnaA [Profundibacterium mesophilum KAUST100406-0324]
MTNDIWSDIRQGLRNAVGQNNYKTWIEPLEFADLTDGIATFVVPSQFVGNWVSRNYGEQIIREIAASGASARRIDFRVERPAASAPPVAADPGAPAQPTAKASDAAPGDARAPAPAKPARPGGMEIQGASLDRNYTFDSFVVGKPNELAHAAARRVAEGGPVTFNPLFLYGGVGLGKTHLMHAIAWELQARERGTRVLYLSAEQFMYRFVQALRDKQMMDFKQLFRSVDVLMVDDVQFIAGKDSTQEEFFHTFNALVDQRKQIIISADRAPQEIEGLEGRIASRLQSGLVVDVHPTNYELRLGILQQKVEQYSTQFSDVRLASGVLEFLAHRITSNVRVLEGALTRLFAFGSLIGREIDVAATQECLTDILRSSDRKTTIDEIQRKVSDHYNIRLADLIGPKRLRIYARPRQIAMFLCKQMTQRSLPEIGRHFGGRDHTTILHGIKRIEALKSTDSQIAEDLEMLRRALSAD